MSQRSELLHKMITAERKNTSETLVCLRAQARAWRQLALIAIVDPDWARSRIGWLFFQTVPFVNLDVIEEFVLETFDRAQQCGIETGVFSKPPPDS